MKIRILAFLLVLVALLASPAFAAVELNTDAATSFSYDYQSLDDDEEDEITLSFDAVLLNSGTDTETVTLTVSSTDTDYSVDFTTSTDAAFDIAAGATNTISLDVTVDVSDGLFDEGTYDDVIALQVYTALGDTSTINFDAEVLSMVELSEIIFYIDDDEEDSMEESESDDGDVDLEVTPGDEVSIFFDLENLFDSTFDDGDMDIEVTIEMDDSDFGDDIDEDVSFNIDAGDDIDDGDEDTAVEFTVPTDAEEGDDYDLTISFEIEDDSGAEYTIEWVATLEVERDNDDVRIDEMSSYPESVECGESFGITIDVTNYGSDRQRDMFIEVETGKLSESNDADFELGYGHDNDENEETLSFQFFVDEDQAEGDYDITARMYFDSDLDDLADSEQIEISVTCTEEVVEVKEEVETIVLETSSDSNVEEEVEVIEGTAEKVSTVEKSYTSNDVEFGLTVALIILVVLAILALLMVGLRKK